jgi:hypothetical protein
MTSEIVEAEGHLIDSGNLQAILTTIVEHPAEYEILRLDVGRTNESPSRLSLKLLAPSNDSLQNLLAKLSVFGCYVKGTPDAVLRQADMDGAAPEDFYSTTNHRTSVCIKGAWVTVDHQRMDAALVVENGRITSRKLRDIRKGDLVVCGMQGIRVQPDLQSRDKPTFGFMTNEVSSERRVETVVSRVAEVLRRVRQSGGRIAFVAGPVVVHTGGTEYFCDLIRLGYVEVNTGQPVEHGHRNHMRAINAVRRAGGIGPAVDAGLLTQGIMHACHTHGVHYILAGSIRDDGPLPETMMDLTAAQDAYAEALEDVEVVVMLSSMLHSIGVGNMIPSWVKVICVDINPAVVTKLSDRGSTQTVGVVTDVGLFLHQLATRLKS